MYLDRKVETTSDGKDKYHYLVKCPSCESTRWVQSAKAGRCKSCAGRETYIPSKTPKKNARKYGDGYITKQGYHLVYDGGKYVPAHRLVVGGLPDGWVVHHVDGDKLNNLESNLFPCTKGDHRRSHHSLEKLGYELVRRGLVDFEEGEYTFGASMEKFILENSVNSGDTSASSVGGNPEPSPSWGRCNDYPAREYTQVSGSAEDLSK